VDDPQPRLLVRLVGRHPRVLEPAAVVVRRLARAVGGPHDLRHRVRELAIALLADAALLGQLPLAQQLALALELGVLPVQLDEDADLRAENLGLERLEHVVDRACRVAAEHVLLVLGDRGQEDDRNVLRPLPPLDQLRGLEAVEPRHLDVEEDARKLLLQQCPQCFLSRPGADQVLPERLQDRLEREEVLVDVVDEEETDALVGHGRTRLGSRTRP
jgi:hypothetical protein